MKKLRLFQGASGAADFRIVHRIVDKFVYWLYALKMPSATVRISPRGHRTLSQLAIESRRSMSEVLEEALEAFRRQRFLEQAAAAYDTLAADAPGATAYRKELTSMEGTLSDGLDLGAG